MELKNLHLKLKAFRLRRFDIRNKYIKKKGCEFENNAPVSHGYHVVEKRSLGVDSYDEINYTDSIIVQREEIEELEIWFFGVFYAGIGEDIARHMEGRLFDKKPKKSHLRRKIKEAMRAAHLGARSRLEKAEKADDTHTVRSASSIVINGEKLVLSNMGDYRAVVCRDGDAYHINRRHQRGTNGRHWSRKFIPGVLRKTRACKGVIKPSKGSDFAVRDEKIVWGTEFVILASGGIWEVMNNQEAVNLIRHIEDPQEAAECLAKEAITRMSRSSISCIVIRFD